MRIMHATLVTVALLAAWRTAGATDCAHLPQATAPRALSNDNREAAGTMRDGVLTLRLVIREARWQPDGPAGCAITVRAFAEEGTAARIPGPLIRVSSGTEVRVSVRNTLSTAQWVRGLQARNAAVLDSMEISPGSTHEFRFRADAPGAWYYWAGAANAVVPASNENGQLVGALVVDSAPVSRRRASRSSTDRIFVMTRWTPGGTTGNRGFQVNAINGRSWPNTERLTYVQGDSVRWHVINASDELHMMHLHGFYFRVESRGDAVHDSILARQQKNMPVTVATRRGEWISISWAPERPGNWLFHCHFTTHMSVEQRLDRMPGATTVVPGASHVHAVTARSASDASHATESMAGLLLGITVLPSRVPVAVQPSRPTPARVPRGIEVFADTRARMFGELPGFGFVVQEGARSPASDSLPIPGTALMLTRGEPVRIRVHNRLAIPLAVHWHGIELESYADGVGGFSGMGRHVAPMIAPAGSFVAAFTPPRAGTFMYHVHSEHGDELASGLYAPLIVLEPGQRLDPRSDKILMIGSAGPHATRGATQAPPFVNGTASPDTIHLTAGTTYRLRIIDISTNEAHTVALMAPAGPATWRALARDGRDLPAEYAVSQTARENTAAGVTRDFEFSPPVPGDYRLTITPIIAARLTSAVTTVPIRVDAP